MALLPHYQSFRGSSSRQGTRQHFQKGKGTDCDIGVAPPSRERHACDGHILYHEGLGHKRESSLAFFGMYLYTASQLTWVPFFS